MEDIVDKTIALLIDGDNISYNYVKILLDELNKFGRVTYRRVYGDFSIRKEWKEDILNFSLTPIQQYSYVSSGKNCTDSAMIIDAMDILYKKNTDCICLATSDSDFTKLVTRFKEDKYVVIGAGETKTPDAFKRVCDRFLLLDVLQNDNERKRNDIKENLGFPSLVEIIDTVKTIIDQNADEAGWANFGTVMSSLYQKHNDFNPQNYGVKKKPSNFFATLPDNPFIINVGKIRKNEKEKRATKVLKIGQNQKPAVAQIPAPPPTPKTQPTNNKTLKNTEYSRI